MESKFNFNTIGLFTTDNKNMVAFYRDVMGLQQTGTAKTRM